MRASSGLSLRVSRLNAKQMRDAITSDSNYALTQARDDANVCSRMFVVYLAGTFADDDKTVAELLRTVYQSGSAATGDQP